MKRRISVLPAILLIALLSCVSCRSKGTKTVQGNTAEAAVVTIADEVISVKGKLMIGHEVRSFTATGGTTEYWVVDRSGELVKEYEKAAGDNAKPYTPVYAELKVVDEGKSDDGFAADYAGVYRVVEIVKVAPLGE